MLFDGHNFENECVIKNWLFGRHFSKNHSTSVAGRSAFFSRSCISIDKVMSKVKYLAVKPQLQFTHDGVKAFHGRSVHSNSGSRISGALRSASWVIYHFLHLREYVNIVSLFCFSASNYEKAGKCAALEKF